MGTKNAGAPAWASPLSSRLFQCARPPSIANVSSSGAPTMWCPCASYDAIVPSGARWILASVCGPRPFHCTSKATVTVPSGAKVSTDEPEGRESITMLRRTVSVCGAGGCATTVGAGVEGGK